MGATARNPHDRRYSPDEYLDVVESLRGKHECFEGRLVDWRRMAATTEQHVRVWQHRPMVETFTRHEDGSWGVLAITHGRDAERELTPLQLRRPLVLIDQSIRFAPQATAPGTGQSSVA